ncbi:MAG: LysR family transcriptional regulator, partial [Rhodospirillaceae bacterium]|nr:LysR family transcriptional regulator [Rhodospirillaceae bacterium]
MVDWDKLRVFLAVADAGSFTHAGEVLHLSQSAVSRQIGALEETLNTALFNRHARGLILTEQGELLYRNVREMAGRLNETEALIAESKQKPEGPLVVTAPTGLGSSWLTPRIGEFLKKYPDIDVSLLLADGDLDLGMREADVAIRLIEPTQPDLIRRSLMTIHNHVYGSTDYVRRHGMPKTPADLDDHRLITFTDHPPAPAFVNADWILRAGANGSRPRTPALRVNSVYGIFRAVRSGVGLALLPDYQWIGYLEPVDPAWMRV